MGTNRRYSAQLDQLRDRRILQVVARDQTPDTLKAIEVDREHEPLTTPPQPRPCRAWVRYAGTPVLVDAHVHAWTARAASIRWRVDDERVDAAWVWASAVEPA